MLSSPFRQSYDRSATGKGTGLVSLDWQHGDFLGTVSAERGPLWSTAYNKDAFFDRGHGKYKIDDKGIHFQRIHGGETFLPFSIIEAVELGKRHAGKYTVGNYITKVTWRQKGKQMVTGFVFSKNDTDNAAILAGLKKRLR